MTITAYAFPVLYDVSFPGTPQTPKTNQHGIFVIEYEDGNENYARGYLFNRDSNLNGCAPQILNPTDYDANSWMMCNTRLSKATLEYDDCSIRVQVKPLPLNSPIGKIIRHEYHDIPLKTIRSFNYENNNI